MIWRSLRTVVYPTAPLRAARRASCTSRTVLGPRCHRTPRIASSALVGRIMPSKYESLRTCKYEAFRTLRPRSTLHIRPPQHHAMPARHPLDHDASRLHEPYQLGAAGSGRGGRHALGCAGWREVHDVALEEDPGGGDVDREHPFGVCGGKAVRDDLPVTPANDQTVFHRAYRRERRAGGAQASWQYVGTNGLPRPGGCPDEAHPARLWHDRHAGGKKSAPPTPLI